MSTKIKEIFEHGINEFGLPVLSRGNIPQISGMLVLKMDRMHESICLLCSLFHDLYQDTHGYVSHLLVSLVVLLHLVVLQKAMQVGRCYY